MKKILAIVLAVVMLLPVFAVNVFAAGDAFVLTNYPVDNKPVTFGEEGAKLKGWCPAVLVPWINGDACSTFKTALAKEGAVIEVVTDLKINGLTFQASPIDGKGGYPLVTLTSKLGEATADGKVTTTFSAKDYTDLVANSKYGGEDIPDEPMSFDHWNATGVNTPDNRDTTLYSFRVYVPETESETVVLVENKELAGWNNLFEGDAFNNFKTAIVKEGAKLELNYELAGTSDYYELSFDPVSCSASVNWEETSLSISKDKIVAALGSVENIADLTINAWGGVLSATTFTVVDGKDNALLTIELNNDYPGWTGNILGDENNAKLIEALKDNNAKNIVLNYTMSKTGDWPGGSLSVNGKRTKIDLDKTGKMTLTLDDILAKCVNGDLNKLNGIFSNCNGDTGSINYTSVIVTVPVTEKKKVNGNLAFVYVTDEYHAVLIGGRFLVMPHEEVLGYCPMCHAFIETEPADKSVFVLETTGGQDYDGNQVTVADGVVLVDAEGKGNARIATNWVAGGEAWNAIVKAVPTEDAWLKVTYTGNLTGITFQTEKTSAPEAFETTAPAVVEEGEQNVAWFNCADIVANSPVALSGDFGGWANFMLNFEGDTTVYGFEVVVPAVVPTAE